MKNRPARKRSAVVDYRRPKAEIAAEPRGVWLTRFVLAIAAALVIARLLMSEALRSPEEILPGSRLPSNGPGPAAGVVLDLLGTLCPLLVLVRRKLDHTFRPSFTLAGVLMLAIAAWALISAIWAPDRFAAAVMAFHLLSAASICWAVAQSVNSWRDVRLATALCAGLLACVAGKGIAYVLYEAPALAANFEELKKEKAALRQNSARPATTPTTASVRLSDDDESAFGSQQLEKKIRNAEVMGFNQSANTYAAVLAMLSCTTLGVAADSAARRRWLAFTFLALTLAAAAWILPKTNSRTGLLTAGLGATIVIVFGLCAKRARTYAGRLYVLGLAAALGSIAFVVGYGITKGTLFHDSLNFRWRYWVGAFDIWRGRPVFGTGWENFGSPYLGVRQLLATEEIRDPHNFLMRFLAETGAIGAVLALAWVARTWWELSRPLTPAADTDGTTARRGALGPFVVVALGVLLCIVANTDFNFANDELVAYAVWEGLVRIIAMLLILVIGGAAVLLLRRPEPLAPAELTVFEAPATWPLVGLLAGAGMMFIHASMDFALFEAGPMHLLGWMLGIGLGARLAGTANVASVPTSPRSLGRWADRFTLPVAGAAWVVLAILLVVPVCSGESLARSADTNLRLDRARAAAGELEMAFNAAPRNPDYAQRAAVAWLYAGDPRRGKAMADAAVDANPNDPSLRRFRASLLSAGVLTDLPAAAEDFSAAVRLDPYELPPRIRYARVLEQLNRKSDAAEAYRKALDLDSQLPPEEKDRLPAAMVTEARAALERLK